MGDKYKERLDHLYSQYPVSTSEPEGSSTSFNYAETLSIITILCFFSVIGTLGNGLVLYVFTRTRFKLTSTIFILALAGTDFVTCVIIIPFTVITIHVDYYLPFDSLCKIYQFLITCTVPLSAFIMVAIAVDRYICICHPFAHIMTVRRAKIIVGILTAFAVVLGLITSLGFSIYLVDKESETDYRSNVTSSGSEIIFYNNLTSNDSLNENPGFFTNGPYIISGENSNTNEDTRQCSQKPILFSLEFIYVYQKIYSSFYLCSLLIVLILYSLIYRSVINQRAKRRVQKKKAGRVKQVNTQCQTDESAMPLTDMANKNNNPAPNNHDLKVEIDGETVCTKLLSAQQENGNTKSETHPIKKSPSVRKDTANGEHHKDKRDHDRLANIKTAVMLFIVTIVFIFAFLPAWLMALYLLDFNVVVFYMYFAYNVANPVIYAFMNQMFRENMCRIFSSCRMCMNSNR